MVYDQLHDVIMNNKNTINYYHLPVMQLVAHLQSYTP